MNMNMSEFTVFYLLALPALMIINVAQIAKQAHNQVLSWIQFLVYLGTMSWFGFLAANNSGFTFEFLLITSLLYIGAFVLEAVDFKGSEKKFLAFVALVLSAFPTLMTIFILVWLAVQ